MSDVSSASHLLSILSSPRFFLLPSATVGVRPILGSSENIELPIAGDVTLIAPKGRILKRLPTYRPSSQSVKEFKS